MAIKLLPVLPTPPAPNPTAKFPKLMHTEVNAGNIAFMLTPIDGVFIATNSSVRVGDKVSSWYSLKLVDHNEPTTLQNVVD